MKKLSLILLFAGINIFAQGTSPNSNGWGDTSIIKNFKADSLKYSKAFNLSNWENCRFDVLAMDTANSKTTFGSSAIKFYWWLSTGHISLNYLSGKQDTVWSRIDPIFIDTFDITTSANMIAVPRIVDSTGYFPRPKKTIDTISVRGFALQSRAITPEWDELVRIGVKGLTGNRTAAGGFVKVLVAMHRRAFQNVRSR